MCKESNIVDVVEQLEEVIVDPGVFFGVVAFDQGLKKHQPAIFSSVGEDLLHLPIDDKPHFLLSGAQHVLLELLRAIDGSDLLLRLAHANQAETAFFADAVLQ